jgi:hypothetical protein
LDRKCMNWSDTITEETKNAKVDCSVAAVSDAQL